MPSRASASSDSTRSTIAGALKSGVAAGGSAPLVVPGSVTDRVEQGQPELLGVLLVALHLHDGEPVRLTRPVGPGAQQRRLPAAGRSRDDRHLPRRRAIQGSEKITPVDQPGSCWSHRHRPALISTPDTLAPVTQSWHLSPSVSGKRTRCQRRANRFRRIPSRAIPPRPALTRCGGSPGPGDDRSPGWRQAWARRESSHGRQGRAPRSKGDTVTSPASGAGSAPDLPDYAPTTRSAQSETGRAASSAATAGGGNRRLGLALLVIATAQLMVVLDATIVNVALPLHPAGTWLLRQRPGVGGERLRGHLRRPAPARRPRR